MTTEETSNPIELIKVQSRDHDALMQLARDLAMNLVFTDRHCRDVQEIRTSFMIIALGGLVGRDPDDIGLIYEYFTEAGPRSCNGLPMFLSMQLLNKSDAEIVFNEYARIRDAMNPVSESNELQFNG